MSNVNWQKSTYSSEGNNCVELGRSHASDVVQVRESEEPGTVLHSSPARIADLLAAVKCGRLKP
ncbi:DUF397 domain-containing protein [Streptomyces sp. XM4193]|uniref:DUF397 domain-containing protein n=1 Tax=Streptomyces sp. XM4193 TaxID=2929782 RepID=UPI001FF9C17F|nr:DUF397 domain-containing protein [Streptomyces sp. XM4193]MCK1795741.1 DUF397 domain-containing protein [Streptomyces sp. XM4193]